MALLELLVLLEGQRVDGAHEAELALELAQAGGGRDALGQLGGRGVDGGLGLAVELAAAHLDGGLEAQAGLGLVDLGPTGPLAHLFEAALLVDPLAAEHVEAVGDRPGRPRSGGGGARAGR